jgi:hypothetical protein
MKELANLYDRLGRHIVKANPLDHKEMTIPNSPKQQFGQWQDTQMVPYPGSPDQRCDTVASIIDTESYGQPWLVAYELKTKPELRSRSQLLGYMASLEEELKPDNEPGSRYLVTGMIINLTGNQDNWPEKQLGKTSLRSLPSVMIINLSQWNAIEILDQIEAKTRSPYGLYWISLMQHGDEPEVIERWKRIAKSQLTPEQCTDYAYVVTVFSELAKRFDLWSEALKEWNVTESPFANSLIDIGIQKGEAIGIQKGKQEGEAIGIQKGKWIARIQMIQEMKGETVQTEESLKELTIDQLQQLFQSLKAK